MLSDHAALFEAERPRLMGLGYRMLGSLAEAEDVVQDAFLRFQAVDLVAIEDRRGYLSKIVARLCLDRLKSARARRERYVGTWLPEPLVESGAPPADASRELADDLSFALLLTLERLTPPERTAFLLHDVFGMEFEAIAQVLERTSASCRKLAERARAQVQAERPRFTPKPDEEARLLQAFLTASASGDVAALTSLLAGDAILYTDGGGKRRAALNPIHGAERVARFFAGLARKNRTLVPMPSAIVPRRVNNLPGWVLAYEDGDLAVAAAEVRNDVIARIYIVRNPDKLRHLRQ